MPGSHKAQAPLTFVELAVTRAKIALHPAIIQSVPVAGGYPFEELAMTGFVT
jgi:hypothetical protein